MTQLDRYAAKIVCLPLRRHRKILTAYLNPIIEQRKLVAEKKNLGSDQEIEHHNVSQFQV